MKILAFSDTHLDEEAKVKLEKKAQRADLVVCAGDITIFGSGTKEELEWLNGLGKRVILVHGNHENPAEVEKRCRKLKNITFLHKSTAEIDGVVFVGYGGDGFSLVDKEFEKFALRLSLPKEKKVVLVTHQPPHNTIIDYIWDHHGNKSYRKFIEKSKPVLAVSGHLHENAGKEDTIGTCRVVNAGIKGKMLRV